MRLYALLPFVRPKHLLIACFPKSGSTYLSKVLSLAAGFPIRSMVYTYEHREQDLCEAKLRLHSRRSVVQQHVKATEHNVALIQKYRLRPIVLVRNIFDVMISLDDHLMGEDVRAPTGFVHREYVAMDFDARLNYLIRVHLPWYFNFFMSWREAPRSLQTFPLSYERLFADVPQTMAEILDFYRVNVSRARIDEAVRKVRNESTRFNKGISGRGDQLLNARQKQTIREMADAWQINLQEMCSLGLSPQAAAKTFPKAA